MRRLKRMVYMKFKLMLPYLIRREVQCWFCQVWKSPSSLFHFPYMLWLQLPIFPANMARLVVNLKNCRIQKYKHWFCVVEGYHAVPIKNCTDVTILPQVSFTHFTVSTVYLFDKGVPFRACRMFATQPDLESVVLFHLVYGTNYLLI